MARIGLAAASMPMLRETVFAQQASADRGLAADTVWLNANEYPEGPPEAVLRAMSEALPITNRYNYREMAEFNAALAHSVELTPDQVMVGAGSTEVLYCAQHAFTSATRPLIVPDPSFEDPLQLAYALGRRVIRVPLRADYTADVRGLAAAAEKSRGGMISLCNPNNPTSATTSRQDLAWLVGHLPAHTVLLVDEAYIEFVDAPDVETSLGYVRQGKNVVVTRTFSKIYGMAGARAGFGCARPDLIRKMEPYRTLVAPAGVKVLSVVAIRGVQAALAEAMTLLPARKAKVAALRQEMCGWLQQKGLHYIPPQANFILIDIERDTRAFIPELARRGVVVHPPFPKLNHMMRVSIGTEREMTRFREAFDEVYKG